jgi:short-subunit dehydrogenase
MKAMEKTVVLGATSEIAQAVQRVAAQNGKELLLVARSAERLQIMAADLKARGAKHVVTFAGDLADVAVQQRLVEFAERNLPDFDTVLLAYGTMLDQQAAQHSAQMVRQEIESNFVSAASLLTLFAESLERRRTGCIGVITSVAGDRGRRSNYVYGSAKGALSLFVQGLRSRLHPAGVRVITIKPGPVLTPMTAHMSRSGRFARPADVARDIYRALDRRGPDVLYTPWIWRPIMAIVRMTPERIFKRLAF